MNVRELREQLDLTPKEFASFLNVDLRTFQRWEGQLKPPHEPSGPALAVMVGIKESMANAVVTDRSKIRSLIKDSTKIGGLSYLIVKLFDLWTRRGQ